MLVRHSNNDRLTQFQLLL